MCTELSADARKKLSDPVVMLRVFIEVEEKNLERARCELEKEHESVMAERAKLPAWHRPMDAPVWMRRFRKIRRRKEQLEAAKAKLQELEKQQKE